jgi:hypothetical protein
MQKSRFGPLAGHLLSRRGANIARGNERPARRGDQGKGGRSIRPPDARVVLMAISETSSAEASALLSVTEV